MDKAIEAVLATAVVFMSIGTGLVISGKIIEGIVVTIVGVGLIFARGYMKFS